MGEYVYCIRSHEDRIGLCGKNTKMRWMYTNYSDALRGIQAPCPECLKVGKPKRKRNKQ